MSLAIHEAVSKNPEQDLMYWVCRRVPLWRLTCRHAAEGPEPQPEHLPHQGRALVHHPRHGRARPEEPRAAADANTTRRPICSRRRPRPICGRGRCRARPAATRRGRICSTSCSALSAPGPTRTCRGCEAQDAGLLWAPLRKPHENALDEHWLARKTFAEVEHPELGRSFRYPTSKWLSNKTSWQVGRRAPLLGEDTEAVLGEAARRPSVPAAAAQGRKPAPLGNARQAVPAAGHQDFRFRVVSRLGRRHAVSRRDGRGELQGRVEGQSRYAAGGDGAGRRPRRARRGDRPAARGAATPTWAAISSTRTPASAASR